MPRTVTLTDIARAAGVHVTTVSAVLNGGRSNSRVSPETRDRVLAIARGLGYAPNAAARALRKGRHSAIGVVLPFPWAGLVVTNAYSVGILNGVLVAAEQRGWGVLHPGKHWTDAPASLSTYRAQAVDGYVVVAPPPASDIVTALSRAHVPLVLASHDGTPHGLPWVGVDNAEGMRLLLNHLIAQGHRRVAFLIDEHPPADALAREAAFRSMAERAGLSVPDGYVDVATYDQASTRAALQRFTALPEPPTAICAVNDELAVHLVAAARALGIAVPERLSITGFDDQPDAARVAPGLTTVRQPLAEIGQAAVRLLATAIEGQPSAPCLMTPTLVARGSTAPPHP